MTLAGAVFGVARLKPVHFSLRIYWILVHLLAFAVHCPLAEL